MPKGPELTGFQKGQISVLSEEGFSSRKIAERLGIPKSTVSFNLKKEKKTGSMDNKPRSGRPKMLTPAEERNLVLRCKREPFKPATELGRDMSAATGKTYAESSLQPLS